jgi:pimeloyl-ACP methyl ester carboxylesterase
MGHRVFTPTLTGLGERSHLLADDITLSTHIADVANVITWEDLGEVVLVGHSYGGWVISGVAERSFSHIASIVFLDALLPENGRTPMSYGLPGSEEAVRKARAEGGISWPCPTAEAFGVSGEADRRWVDSKLTEHPISAAMQPIRLTGARDRIPKRTYIFAAGCGGALNSHQIGLSDSLEREGWSVFMVPCGHDVMVDMPDQLVEILAGVV